MITPGEWAGKSIVIFGCGYLGGALAREAVGRGCAVTALTRNPKTAEFLGRVGVGKVVKASLEDHAWHRLVDNAQDFAVNCVGSGGGGEAGYRRSYLDGQRSILRWMANGRVGTVLYTSSTSVYPQGGGELVLEESAGAEPGSWRGQIIRASERLLEAGMAGVGDGRWFILRLAGLYGPGRHRFLDLCLGAREEIPPDSDVHLNLIHRDDACSAIAAALEAPSHIRNEILNVSDGSPHRKSKIAAWVAEIPDRPKPEGSSHKASPRSTSRQAPDRRISNEKIRDLLGWSPKYPSFREGYRDILRSSVVQ
jgi:nucleoside-diphosphate-sugar epimerase